MNARHLWFGLFVVVLFSLPLLSAASEAPSPDPRRRRGAKSEVPDSSKWSVQQAVANMRSPDKRLRLAALKRIAKERGENIQKWIAGSAQNDPEARIRYEAVKILQKRREKASIPVLERIAKTDGDERVSKAAGAAYIEATGKKLSVAPSSSRRPATPPPAPAPPPPPLGAKAGQIAPTAPAPAKQTPTAPSGSQPPPSKQPTAAKPAQPSQPTESEPPEKELSKNEMGHELPPGYEDGWEMDREKIIDKKDRADTHYGFMPEVGWDGTMGAPRDTLARTSIGLIVGLEAGSYEGMFASSREGANTLVEADNKYSFKDFSLVLAGKFSPSDFFEIGVDLEVLTAEKLSHKQSWYQDNNSDDIVERNSAESIPEDEDLYRDTGYSGAALGFVTANLKLLFVRTEAFRMGLAVRGLFPSHTGDRQDQGIGASSLYVTTDTPTPKTQDGLFWGIEPGLVASYMPIDHLSIYADITFVTVIMRYKKNVGAGDYVGDMDALNFYLIPHLGAQYRLLNDDLGFQLAIAPSIYLGTAETANFASFGLVPGVLYRIADMIDLSLTANIEIGANAPGPLLCPGDDLVTNAGDKPAPCGIGRRFGMALAAGYDF
ncbi:MAG: hypothetical protein GY854_22265 [Deltaproteobacteria bacterium]|nr:hypothetical protein [Deltaproteobacteria bacterium]